MTDTLKAALETIASLPMPEQDNMLAANMRHIARTALTTPPPSKSEAAQPVEELPHFSIITAICRLALVNRSEPLVHQIDRLVAALPDGAQRKNLHHLLDSSTRNDIRRPASPRTRLVPACYEAQDRQAAAGQPAERVALTDADVEWVVNDIAELGVKIGDQFFFLYKGMSLVYGESIDAPTDGICKHDDGGQMHWRPVFKREFGECCHPINYKDPTRIGTVSLEDSDEWKPLPAPRGIGPTSGGAG